MNAATEQAKEYGGMFAPTELTLDDGTVIVVPPHPELKMLDDDAQAELEALQVDIQENYDREPDIYIPEQKVKDRDGNDMVLPADVQRGELKQPFRKKGKPMKPPYTVRVVQIAIGEEQYAKLRAGTIDGRKASAADVYRIWNERSSDLLRRQKSDSKSEAGAGVLEDVPAPDSQ